MSEISKLKDLLLDSEMLDELKSKADSSVNIFDVLKATDTEIRHSNMLSWLLDPGANHGLGQEIIRRLLNWFANEYVISPDEAVYLLMSNCYSFSIRREWRSIDLLLVSSEAKIVIAIENKIYSGEHSGQLERYKNTIAEQFPGYRQYFLYLTLDEEESSAPEIWRSVGYEKIIEWTTASLDKTVNQDAKVIINQYLEILRRKVMGYSDEVVELCNKIYQKHKTALDLIYEVVGEDEGGVCEITGWADEWERDKRIVRQYTQGKMLCFRTPALEKMFPVSENCPQWACYYMILNLPFPRTVTFEFCSEGLVRGMDKKFNKIKPHFSKKTLKENWMYHRIKTWKLHDYNPEQTEDFTSIADDLRAELERIIFTEIPSFEEDMRGIIEGKTEGL